MISNELNGRSRVRDIARWRTSFVATPCVTKRHGDTTEEEEEKKRQRGEASISYNSQWSKARMDENEQGGKYREPPMVRTQWAEERPGERERERGSEGMNGELGFSTDMRSTGCCSLQSARIASSRQLPVKFICNKIKIKINTEYMFERKKKENKYQRKKQNCDTRLTTCDMITRAISNLAYPIIKIKYIQPCMKVQQRVRRCDEFTRPFGARATKDSYLQDVFKNNYRGRSSDSHGVALTFVLPALWSGSSLLRHKGSPSQPLQCQSAEVQIEKVKEQPCGTLNDQFSFTKFTEIQRINAINEIPNNSLLVERQFFEKTRNSVTTACTPTPCNAATPPTSSSLHLRRFGAQTMATLRGVIPVSAPRAATLTK
ncbi:hypothetical protein WN51_04530 [Melipona quadrifasciata]|uniref:Uncharacterized protein n=1 Tax=Melipona quadrifasciata TaxID=166423 RepID=A0A0M8ZS53_9HYME|nr:hypothetical protein WN51_04530 [Melipona quadrifasciata]